MLKLRIFRTPATAALVCALALSPAPARASGKASAEALAALENLIKAQRLRGTLVDKETAAETAYHEAWRIYEAHKNSPEAADLRKKAESLLKTCEEAKTRLRNWDAHLQSLTARLHAASGETKEPVREKKATPLQPFFCADDRSSPGEVGRIGLITVDPGALPKAARFIRYDDGGLWWISADAREVGCVAPDMERSALELEMPELLGGGYLHPLNLVHTPEAALLLGLDRRGRMVIRGSRPGRRLFMPVMDAPLEGGRAWLVTLGGDPWVITPRGLYHMSVTWKTGSFTCSRHPLPEGAVLAEDSKFLTDAAGHLFVLEPSLGALGWLNFVAMRPARGGGGAGEAMAPSAVKMLLDFERVTLPDKGIPGGMALVPATSDLTHGQPCLAVTDRVNDRILIWRTSDLTLLRVLELAKGSAPGEIVAGPEGSMIFAVDGGFGCLTAKGRLVRLRLKGKVDQATCLVPGLEAGKLYFLEKRKGGILALTLSQKPGGLDPALLEGLSLEPGKALEEGTVPAAAAAATASKPASPVAAAPEAKAEAGEDPDEGEEDKDGRVEAKAGAGESTTSGAGQEGKAPRNLEQRRGIPKGTLAHIRDEHGHQDGTPPAMNGFVKGQFEPWVTRTDRSLKEFLFTRINSREAAIIPLEGLEDEVRIEVDCDRIIGRVRPRHGTSWVATRRLRAQLVFDPDLGIHVLKTAFPVQAPGR